MFLLTKKKRRTRAALSLLLVMQYAQSLLICRSVTTSLCARSLLSTSSPVLTLKRATLPDSCPVIITFGVNVNAQTVAFEPIGLNMYRGSFDSVTRKKNIVREKKYQMTALSHTFCPIASRVDFEYSDRTLVSHSLLCYADYLRSLLVERYPLHSRREFPCI